MKRKFMLLIIGLSTLALVACSQIGVDANTISVGELTEREDAILSTASDKSFVFDFNVDDEYKEVAIWIEKYEAGNLVNDSLGYMTTEAEQSGSIIFTLSEDVNDVNNIFNIGVSTEESLTSAHVPDEKSNDVENMSSEWGSIPEKVALDNGEVVLANISYSDNENGMHSLTTDFYEGAAGHMNELEQYDVVYLLKAEFSK
ncbi:hypothetical protein [Oceanobacillus jeddahense]|uniref:Lipoprotein n=1 Tax=Oceanobacillus jeddahense TaxID=1462527 RepID=A0ABY5JQM3_9BACI|nr:hypothetical protein [Oceanobacillus jeddahense]UUI02104.1 hypothetical protein NP439_18970 [Oceanobacillus jeddahense]